METHENNDPELTDDSERKDMLISELKDLNNRLTVKNVSLAKEMKINQLALTECIFEKAEVEKQLRTLRENLNDVVKHNAVISEELNVKKEIIKALKETNDTTEKEVTKATDVVDITSATEKTKSTEGENIDIEKQKCDKCDFETSVKKYL